MEISRSGLNNDNPLDCLKLCYQVSPKKLRDAFANVLMKVEDEKDLEILAKVIQNKMDVEGKFRDPNDESIPLMFDSMRIIHGIEFSPEEEEKATSLIYIKWIQVK